MWSYGYKAPELERLFNSIPLELAAPIQKGFLALQTMHRMQAFNTRLLPQRGESCNRPDESNTICSIPDELNANSVYGVLQFSYDPRTNKRKQVVMNARYAELHGFHQEEFLTRFANHDLDLHHTDVDSIIITNSNCIIT